MDSYTQLQQLAGAKARNFPSLIIFGNKSDLSSSRKVPRLEAERYASDKHCPYLEGSAFTEGGLQDLLDVTVRELRKQKTNHRTATMHGQMHTVQACGGCKIF
jgi:Ras family